ncbi:phosphoserine aminotransferase [Choiromyces venosus 120613-1]|uniref:phosphoserine transaminase n=1 Tax=Choiromyces venosus 120613-1 TaxID=1336337 RepID=A0A3N4JCI9_9PEZI|nr:phosphoserine aminotransferase [Choiromyces venosus 120613-1]
MPTREEITYFGAGPASLPTTVLQNASSAILNFQNTGLGLAEHSHRSALSNDILAATENSLRSLLSIPEDYAVLFMQGGGTTQFSAVAYNLLGYWVQTQLNKANGDIEVVREKLKKAKMDYVVTGGWSQKGSEEAKRLFGDGIVNVVTDSKKGFGEYCGIEEEKKWKRTAGEDNVFTYYCDNETVDGVEFPGFPKSLEGGVVAADMSSNILSRRVDVSKFHIIFAGAQKNIGTTGLTIVILKSAILQTQPTPATLRALYLPIPPIMMSYPILAKNNSLYNTLPIFDVWIAGEVMKELVAAGGLAKQEDVANRKAGKIYAAVARAPGIFKVVPLEGARSRMNICVRAQPAELEGVFLKGAEERGLLGLKGHRSVGGIRISNCMPCFTSLFSCILWLTWKPADNSITEAGVDKLVQYIDEFVQKNA